MKKSLYILLLGLFSLLLVSCGNSENTIYVAASPKPHAEILEAARPLLKEKGYKLKIKVLDDYITPNQAVTLKQVDANYFQHEPYLHSYNAEYDTNIVSVGKIHIEPIGIYSKKYKNLSEVEDGAIVEISESKADHGRLLNLLEEAGLITLKAGVAPFQATLDDIATNPKNLVINAKKPAQNLIDVYNENQADLILINSNFALAGGLEPGKDAIAKETPTNNPFANLIGVLPENKDNPKIKALVEVLTSKEIAKFINEKWGGDIVPAA